MKKIFIISIALFTINFAKAQQWTNFTTANSGLVNDYINSIAEDTSGNMWFGTNGGVSKFDGTTWTNYTTANSGLVSDTVNAIAIDDQNKIWFGTMAGVSKFKNGVWTTYNQSNSGLASNVVNCIAIDNQSYKWIGLVNSNGLGGLSKYDGINWTTYYQLGASIFLNNIKAIVVDTLNNKWFVDPYQKIFKLHDTTWTIYNQSTVSSCNPTSITVDSKNNKWIGAFGSTTYDGVFKFDDISWTSYGTANGLLNNYVTSVGIDSHGSKWFGSVGINLPGGGQTIGGISRFNENLFPNWTNYTAVNGLVYNNVTCIKVDHNDCKWFGTQLGISKFCDVYAGIEENNSDSKISVFPNPASGHITVSNAQKSYFNLYDISGRKVLQKYIDEKNEIINLSLSSGVYFYDIGKTKGKIVVL